jgi:hypothetical protein
MAKRATPRTPSSKSDAPPSGTVKAWEDDPETNVLVDRPAPDLSATPLAFSFDQTAPPAAVYQPGTLEFRYWTAAEALRRGADFWAPLMPKAQWQGDRDTLKVILDASEDLNAYYDRDALNFFHGAGATGTVYSGESPDIVCHEMGHAILDSIKPQLWDATSNEVAAFHESFADISAILSALQLPSLRSAILTDTAGSLYRSSRLSRLAEQLGSAIRLIQSDAVEPDCLRNAVNSWTYQDPNALPQGGPSTQLTSEAHNFSRVFTSAAFEILAGVLSLKAGSNPPKEADLQAASVDFARILIEGVVQAPVAPNWYAQVAAAMVNASAAHNASYPAVLNSAFVRRSILSLDSATSVRQLHLSIAAKAAATDVKQPLSELALPGDDYGLDDAIVVMAASHSRPFIAKAGATLQNGSLEPVSSSTAARGYLDDLFTRGRIDTRKIDSIATHFHHGRRLCSHEFVREKKAVRLRRRFFDCGFDV